VTEVVATDRGQVPAAWRRSWRSSRASNDQHRIHVRVHCAPGQPRGPVCSDSTTRMRPSMAAEEGKDVLGASSFSRTGLEQTAAPGKPFPHGGQRAWAAEVERGPVISTPVVDNRLWQKDEAMPREALPGGCRSPGCASWSPAWRSSILPRQVCRGRTLSGQHPFRSANLRRLPSRPRPI